MDMRFTRLLPVLCLFAGVGLALTPTSAFATFPGESGLIAFSSDRYGQTHNMFTMQPDGSDVRQLTFLTAAQGAAFWATWSPDGTKLVFQERNADLSSDQIWVMDRDGSNRHRLFSDPGYVDFRPGYSPDGTQVVLDRCRTDFEACAIYRVSADGHGLTAITHLDATRNVVDGAPEYSPDGRTIAFPSFNRGGVIAAIYVMDASGRNIHRVTPTALEAFDSDWSPDGSRLIFSTHCCNPLHSAIWSMRSDGTDLRQISFPGASHDVNPEYAPGGQRIVLERDSPDFSTFSIVTMNASGGDVHTIQTDAFLPDWGPSA
jgi:Tol biopolymer transport system component